MNNNTTSNNTPLPPFVVITGPTACGKTTFAVALARALDGEIVSADSRQFYRGMDIGTGKDLGDYGDVPYHLIDIADAGERYNLHHFLRDARAVIRDIDSRGRLPIVCGGTGLYIEALLRGDNMPDVPVNDVLRDRLASLSDERLASMLSEMRTLHNTTDTCERERVIRAIEIADYCDAHPEECAPIRCSATACYVLDIPRDLRRERISKRLRSRLAEGMVEEIQRLLDSGVTPEQLMYYGLEYRFVTEYLVGLRDYDSMVADLETAIHQFAKRQLTWLRGMERRGFPLTHVPYTANPLSLVDDIKEKLHR